MINDNKRMPTSKYGAYKHLPTIFTNAKIALLKRWRINKLANDEAITAFEQETHDRLVALLSSPQPDQPNPETLAFLNRDFGDVDVAALPSELTSQQIVRARLDEIERCVRAEAPLAVILLVGSTLR